MAQRPVALVTGSGKRRVGWHVAAALAARGYALVLHYRTSSAEAAESVAAFQAQGIPVLPHQADLADEAAVRGLFATALERFGRLDVLVNCAAIWRPRR